MCAGGPRVRVGADGHVRRLHAGRVAQRLGACHGGCQPLWRIVAQRSINITPRDEPRNLQLGDEHIRSLRQGGIVGAQVNGSVWCDISGRPVGRHDERGRDGQLLATRRDALKCVSVEDARPAALRHSHRRRTCHERDIIERDGKAESPCQACVEGVPPSALHHGRDARVALGLVDDRRCELVSAAASRLERGADSVNHCFTRQDDERRRRRRRRRRQKWRWRQLQLRRWR